MKKFFNLILLLVLFFPFCPAGAEEKSAVILELDERPPAQPLEMEEIVNHFIDTAKYFDTQYPGDKIEQDFREDVARQFPALSAQEVYDYEDYIRNGMRIYRYFKGIYNRYVEAALTPEEPPLIAEDHEYDLSGPKNDYIDADGTVVIQDFKKIISYSQNPREIKAYRAKFARDAEKGNKKDDFAELGYIFSKLEFKKLLFYDVLYENPFTGQRGIGDWEKKDNFKIRLISEQSGIPANNQIRGLVHLLIPSRQLVTAVDGGLHFKPKISFERSQNLGQIEYTMPLPTRLANASEDHGVYVGEIAVPFSAEAADPQKEMILQADIELELCDLSEQCEKSAFSPALKLFPGYERDSSVATYVRMMFNFLSPQPQSDVKLLSFNRETTPDGKEILLLRFESPETIESFNIFAGNRDGISFERPRVSIDGKKALIRLLPLENNISTAGRKFEITGEVNRKYAFRRTLVPLDAPVPLSDHNGFSWLILLAAVAGGLLLNFMPCVFPVLSLKLLSLTKFGARNAAAVRRNFSYTLLGIWSAFILLALFLAALKWSGYIIGWGMQFQNPWFISLIFFAVLLFIAQIWGIVEIKMPVRLNRLTNNGHENGLLHFMTGSFVVLMSTPCTAPYLGTAIGFALAGSYFDLFTILAGVAFGLSLPYLLVYLLPGLAIMIPPPGPWMKKVSRFMLLMLFLTLAWLLHVVYVQSGTGFTIRLIFYALLFWFILWLRDFSSHLEYEQLSAQSRALAVRRFNAFFAALAVLLFIGASVDGYYAGRRHHKQNQNTASVSVINRQIDAYVQQGKTVIVAVDADWCLTCRYNDVMVFKNPAVVQKLKSHKVAVINIDWTIGNPETAEFMKKYGRSGLPFYILFSPLVPDGMVLPELLNEQELNQLIDNMSLSTPTP